MKKALHTLLASSLLLAALAAATPAGAQAQKGSALLVKGPYLVRGIPFLDPNSLPAYRGEYQTQEGRLEVLFTRQPLVLPQEWKSQRCGKLRLVQVPWENGYTVCYQDEKGFFLFFSFSFAGPGRCAFIESFLQRFLYLLSFVQNEVDVPLPAVLEWAR